MPSRIIREGHLDSERVDALSEQAENFYSRLRLVVDDYGRFEADPIVLLARTYPRRVNRYTPDQISQWLAECGCGEEPLVTIYQVGRKRYLQVNGFGQRQRTDSKYPAPPNSVDVNSPASGGQMTDSGRANAGLARATTTHTTTHTTTNSGEGGVGEIARDPGPRLVADETWGAFAEVALKAGMLASDEEFRIVEETLWPRLEWEQKRLAIDGVKLRVESGEYGDPAFVPLLDRYVRKRLWTRPPRAAPSRSNDAKASGSRDFDERVMRKVGNPSRV